jgi:phosphoribosylformimino-5-aminoimidazole carboxamide ribotide isomerase
MSIAIVPAIDIIDGQLVRLREGRYDAVTTYPTHPVDMAKRYRDDYGLTHIHIVDLNGAVDGQLTNLSTIQAIANLPNISVQVGGGVRHMNHCRQLVDSGVDAVIIGSLIASNFATFTTCVTTFPDRIIAGLDIKNDCLAVSGWTTETQLGIPDLATALNALPLHSIISTDIARDGTFGGLNLDLYTTLSDACRHRIIASGGVASIEDIMALRALNRPNIVGCIVGKAIIEGRITADDIRSLA